jgi:hypothetical protein
MKLALVDDFVPALVVGDEVVDVSGALHGMEAGPPPGRVARIIERFGQLRPALEDAARGGRPKPWPSIEARERRMDLPPGTFSPAPPRLGRGGYVELVGKLIAICKCLVDANQLRATRVQMIVLPMRIRNGGASPCRFIAVEE